jgi:hypothetical protein
VKAIFDFQFLIFDSSNKRHPARPSSFAVLVVPWWLALTFKSKIANQKIENPLHFGGRAMAR